MASSRKFGKRELARIFREAEAAGIAAGRDAVPTPMVVFQPRAGDLFTERESDITRAVKVYEPVMDGVCGFAEIVIRPGNSSAANFAKARYGASKRYHGGVGIWVSSYGQSYERKMAYAVAFAGILRDAGINAYADGRLD
jgi:hypothetical protein